MPTFAQAVTAAADLVTSLGIMPLVVAGAVISLFGILIRKVKSGVR